MVSLVPMLPAYPVAVSVRTFFSFTLLAVGVVLIAVGLSRFIRRMDEQAEAVAKGSRLSGRLLRWLMVGFLVLLLGGLLVAIVVMLLQTGRM